MPTRAGPAELRAATAGPPPGGSLGHSAPLKSWRLPTQQDPHELGPQHMHNRLLATPTPQARHKLHQSCTHLGAPLPQALRWPLAATCGLCSTPPLSHTTLYTITTLGTACLPASQRQLPLASQPSGTSGDSVPWEQCTVYIQLPAYTWGTFQPPSPHHPHLLPHGSAGKLSAAQGLLPHHPWYLPLQLLPSFCSVPVTQLHRGPSTWLVQICSQPPLSSHQSDPGHKEQRKTPKGYFQTSSP